MCPRDAAEGTPKRANGQDGGGRAVVRASVAFFCSPVPQGVTLRPGDILAGSDRPIAAAHERLPARDGSVPVAEAARQVAGDALAARPGRE